MKRAFLVQYALVVVLVVAGLGVGTYFGVSELLLESAEPPSVDEAVEALEADTLSPRFEGEIAGLTIVPKEGQEYAYDTHCSTPQWEEYGGVEPGYTTGTEIDIPPISGFEIVRQQVAWCDGRVAFNSVSMQSPTGGTSINITRVLADPVLHVDIPAARVEQVTLNGQPAVHILPILLDGLYALSSERVYIVEDFGITNISFEGRGDILDIARQVVGGGR